MWRFFFNDKNKTAAQRAANMFESHVPRLTKTHNQNNSVKQITGFQLWNIFASINLTVISMTNGWKKITRNKSTRSKKAVATKKTQNRSVIEVDRMKKKEWWQPKISIAQAWTKIPSVNAVWWIVLLFGWFKYQNNC